jgi:hypothetical protein
MDIAVDGDKDYGTMNRTKMGVIKVRKDVTNCKTNLWKQQGFLTGTCQFRT